MDKNTICELLYIKTIINPKIQNLLDMDNDEINNHLFNAGTMINENVIISDENKKLIHKHIIKNLKK